MPPKNGCNDECEAHAKYVHRVAVTVLAIIALGAPIGMTILTVLRHQIPESLAALGAASIGALVTMLTTVGRRR